MEIYKDLSNPTSQEFEKLLNSQLSKIQIEEGKIIEGKINKITEKFVFLFGQRRKVRIAAHATDADAERLWDVSEELVRPFV